MPPASSSPFSWFSCRAGFLICLATLPGCGELVLPADEFTVEVLGQGAGSGVVSNRDMIPDSEFSISCVVDAGVTTQSCKDEFFDSGGGALVVLRVEPDPGSFVAALGGDREQSSGTECSLRWGTEGSSFRQTVVEFQFVSEVIESDMSDAAEWIQAERNSSNGVTSVVSHLATGGQSGPYREIRHVFPDSGSVRSERGDAREMAHLLHATQDSFGIKD